MKEKTCCFTGHRFIEKNKTESLRELVKAEASKLIDSGYDTFVAGGAIGFDTLAEECVLELKEHYPHIKLHLVLPCIGQDVKWNTAQKLKYKQLLELADSYEYVSTEYTKSCMLDRNRRMVELSSAVIAYYDAKGKGGTAMTVRLAEKNGVVVINLY